MIYYACSKCGKIHPKGYNCQKNKRIWGQRDSEAYKLRNSHKWHLKSEQIKEESLYLCAVCRDEGIYNYTNLEVHHIIPLKDRPDLLMDDKNLITLCSRHHKEADRGSLEISYLKKLALKRIEEHNEKKQIIM